MARAATPTIATRSPRARSTGAPGPRVYIGARPRSGLRGRRVTHPFEEVFALHRNELVRALSITLQDDALAAEAVDEAFTRALHRWNVVGTFANPQAWVYRTARNWAISRFRRRSRDQRYAHKVGSEDVTTDVLPDPELTAALAALPADQRNVLVLRYFLDWKVDTIADALDISPGTVKSRTSRALAELNRTLGGPS